ncbi:hypothetical protein MTR67_039890 [Solanum verrucosum]
MFGSL